MAAVSPVHGTSVVARWPKMHPTGPINLTLDLVFFLKTEAKHQAVRGGVSLRTMERGIAISHDGIHAQTYQLAMIRVCDIGMIHNGGTECFERTRSAGKFG